MPLESATYIDQLVPANPVHGDDVNQGDAHLRLIKSVLQNNFPNFTAAALASTNAAIDAVVGAFYTAGSSLVSLATGVVTLAASLTVNNNVAIGGTLGALGNTTLGGTLGVAGATTLGSALFAPGPNSQSGTTYSIAATDLVVRLTAASCTVTLPTPSTNTNRLLWLFCAFGTLTSASAIVVQGASATPGTLIIGGAAVNEIYTVLQSNGTSWFVVGGDFLNA